MAYTPYPHSPPIFNRIDFSQQAQSPASSLSSRSSHRSQESLNAVQPSNDSPSRTSSQRRNALTPPKKPRPAYNQRSTTQWTNSPVCSHCGSMTPRSGATTVYGTPYMSKPSFMSLDIKEKTDTLFSALEYLQDANPDHLCLVEKVHDNDDFDFLPTWRRRLHSLTPICTFFSITCYWLYFAYRIHCNRSAEQQAQKTFIMAWAFIAVEAGVAIPMIMHQSWQLFRFMSRRRERLRIVGNDTPTVDVFITCCGEENQLVIDTVLAAAAQDWPTHRFRVIVLDDKHDLELERKVGEINSRMPHVMYTARTKIPGVPHHFKAGNLNHGLEYVKSLPGGAGEYMAALDADMIPEPEWLRAIIAHLVVDPKLALSCPPQLFYNVPKNDPLQQSLNSFVHIAETVKDAAGVAWCTGSGYAIRRTAIDEIGWFPTGSLAEDVCTSSMLLGAGWKTAYVHEALQYGTVPDSFVGHIKQRTRWTIGTVQTSLKLNFCLFGPLVKHMTLMQRLSSFVYAISSLFTIFLTMSLFTLPIVLISGGTLVAYSNNDQLRWLIRLCFFAFTTSRLNEYITYIPAGYRIGQREVGAMMWMAPFHSIAVIRAFILPKFLGGKVAAFSSSGSISSELNERDPHLRAPLLRRLRVILWDYKVIMHAVYILFCAVAVILSTVRAFAEGNHSHSASGILMYLLTHAAWPPILWLVCLVSCWVPIGYAIQPPTTPDREELLEKHPVTGVKYPSAKAKVTDWDRSNFLHELLYGCLTVYTYDYVCWDLVFLKGNPDKCMG